jgi:hypothetical protein
VDEDGLERAVGRFMALHLGPGLTVDVNMFADLLLLVTRHGVAVPPEVAAGFRALATVEGTLTTLSPGFDIVAESRAFARAHVRDALVPESMATAVMTEAIKLLPLVRRIPRRLDRITSALEHGRLSTGVRPFADDRDRRVVTGLVHQTLLTILAAATGIVAAILLGTDGGPQVAPGLSLYELLAYNLLIAGGVLTLRVLTSMLSSTTRSCDKPHRSSLWTVSRLRGAGQLLLVAVARHGERSAVDLSEVVERPRVLPALPFVEPPSPIVAGDHSQPGPVVPVGDRLFGVGQQHRGDTASSGRLRHIHLLDLVVVHGDEADHSVIGGGHGCCVDPRSDQPPEIGQPAVLEQFIRNVAEVTVRPPGVPYGGDRLSICFGGRPEVEFGHHVNAKATITKVPSRWWGPALARVAEIASS